MQGTRNTKVNKNKNLITTSFQCSKAQNLRKLWPTSSTCRGDIYRLSAFRKKCGFSVIILMSILVFMGCLCLSIGTIVVEHSIWKEITPWRVCILNLNSTLSFWNFNFWNLIESLLVPERLHLPKIILK